MRDRFELPEGLTAEDEQRHAPPEGATGLFGDTLWLSVVDPEANIFGVLHWHLTNHGFGRHEAYFVIDGVQQSYGMREPLDPEPDAGPWTDGILSYEVVDPFEHIRIQMDGPRFGFDLDFKARFPAFDYHDSVRGDPLAVAYPHHSGHYEQAMDCTGNFEIRGGPAEGESRQINCWSHRDHTWSDRFAEDQAWSLGGGHMPGHFWPSIQLPDRHINVFAFYFQSEWDDDNLDATVGGFESKIDGSRPMLNAAAKILDTDDDKVRDANAFRYQLTMPDGDVIHVRSTKKHGQIKLWLRGDNELENRMDCYEAFVDWEVEETGEKGTGVAEYSIFPPLPQWPI